MADVMDSVGHVMDEQAKLLKQVQLPDSVIAAQQGVAFGSLRFGMSRKDVTSAMGDKQYGFIPIGNENCLMDLKYTGAGQLYQVLFNGDVVMANMIETRVQPSAENLRRVITAKYGPPALLRGYPQFFEYKPGVEFPLYRWRIGTKTIIVAVHEIPSGMQYEALLSIIDEPMAKMMELENSTNAQNSVSKAANQF